MHQSTEGTAGVKGKETIGFGGWPSAHEDYLVLFTLVMMSRPSTCPWLAPATASMTARLLNQPQKHFVGALIKPGDYPAAEGAARARRPQSQDLP
jgi:hypothetical protein